VGLPAVGGVALPTMMLMLFSLFHAWYALGWRHSLAFFGLSAVISWGFEQVGVATGAIYGAYHYTDVLGAKLGHVPLLIPLAWFMMIYPSYIIANLLVGGRPLLSRPGFGRIVWLALVNGMVMTAWDLSVDVMLSGPRVQAWIWRDGGPYFGIPVQNFAGWLLTTFTVYLLYRLVERWVAPKPLADLSLATAVLPLVAYGAMAVSDMLLGDPALRVITPFTMGLPVLVAAGRLLDLRSENERSDVHEAAGRAATVATGRMG
jgi:putative membrane protein